MRRRFCLSYKDVKFKLNSSIAIGSIISTDRLNRPNSGNSKILGNWTYNTGILGLCSINLGFSGPYAQVRCWAVTSFCVQLGNQQDSTR